MAVTFKAYSVQADSLSQEQLDAISASLKGNVPEQYNDLGKLYDFILLNGGTVTNLNDLQLNILDTEPVSGETGKGILYSFKENDIQKLFFLKEDGTKIDLTANTQFSAENNFFVGGANGEVVEKNVAEILEILNLNILDQNNHIKESNLNNNVTLAGRTFNTAGKLVQLDSDGNNGARLPVLDGSQLVDINITKVKNASGQILPNLLDAKVDRVVDENGNDIKELSTNDFTNELKIKLDDIQFGTGLNQVPKNNATGQLDLIADVYVGGRNASGITNGLRFHADGTHSYLDYKGNLDIRPLGATKARFESNGVLAIFEQIYGNSGGGGNLNLNSSGIIYHLSTNGVAISTAWGGNGNLSVDGYLNVVGGSNISDERTKKDIKNISIEKIDAIHKIQIKSFVRKNGQGHTEFGVMAQEVEKLIPEVVHTLDKEIFYKKDEFDKKDKWLKENAFLDPIEEEKDGGVLVKYTVKAVDYNSLFILQNALISDQQSVLRTQGLSFLIDDIKAVYDNEYENTYEVLTIQGDLIKSIEKNGNTQEQRINSWVKSGGKIYKKVFSKEESLAIVKKKAESKILQKYSRDDQRNIDRECLHLKAVEGIDPSRLSAKEKQLLNSHNEMGVYISKILKKCNDLKEQVKILPQGALQNLIKSVINNKEY